MNNEFLLYGEENPHTKNFSKYLFLKISKTLLTSDQQEIWRNIHINTFGLVSEAQLVFGFFVTKELLILGNLKRA